MPERQDAPHLHQAILDPTQQYLLIPDLGADLVRIYGINEQTNKLTAMPPLQAKAGSGPRHGAFSLDLINGHYMFYLVAEITSTVTAYEVTYSETSSGINFSEIGNYSTLGTSKSSTVAAAEVVVSVSHNNPSFPHFGSLYLCLAPNFIASICLYSLRTNLRASHSPSIWS